MFDFVKASRAWAKAAEQIRASLIPPTARLFEGPLWHEAFKELAKAAERLESMLLQLGWPPPGHLPIRLLDEITRDYQTGKLSPEEVEELFVEFYDANQLQQIVATWRQNAHFPHRVKILEQAVAAHAEGRYELSIPAILPQIEGVIAELFGHAGRMSLKAFKQYLSAAFSDSSRFDRVSAAFILRILLEDFTWGDSIPRLSRHAVLHGADTEYASAANSLRVILFFDELQGSVRYVATRGGERFHLAICPRIRRAAKRRVFHSQNDAEEAGLLPCRTCLRHLPHPSQAWPA